MIFLPKARTAWIRVAIEAILFVALLLYMQMTGGVIHTIQDLPYRFNLAMYHLIQRPFDFRVDFFGMIYEGRSGNMLDDQILAYGAQEKSELFFLRDMAVALGEQPIVFYDIGANVGQHSLFMSPYVRAVHAFEPYPPVLKRLNNNIAINHLTNVHVHAVGLGDHNGTIPFFEPPDANMGSGSFTKKWDNTLQTRDGLPLVVGDEYVASERIPLPTIIKCDIEAYEKPALIGLKKTLAQSRPLVLLELTPGYPTSFSSVTDLLNVFPANYAVAAFCDADEQTGAYKVCPYTDERFWDQGPRNLVLYPLELKSKVMMGSQS